MWRLCRAVCFVSLLLVVSPAFADGIRDVVGVAHWGGRYWFPATLQWQYNDAQHPENGFHLIHSDGTPDTTTQVDDLNEGADRLLAMGTRVIYLPLNALPGVWYHYNNPPYGNTIFTSLPADRITAIAKMRPYADLFKKPFSVFFLAIGDNVPVCASAGQACDCGSSGCAEQLQYWGLEGRLGVPEYNFAPVLDGMTDSEKAAEKLAMKNLAAYLLSNPDFIGKTFVLADVEGDWELRSGFVGNEFADFRPSAVRVQAMRDWLDARQAGVNEARQEIPIAASAC
jgi:hypothetical protein